MGEHSHESNQTGTRVGSRKKLKLLSLNKTEQSSGGENGQCGEEDTDVAVEEDFQNRLP